MIKIILKIGILFFLNSCVLFIGYKPYLPSENDLIEQRFPQNKKAIIITRDLNPELHASSLWYKIDDTFDGKVSDSYIWINRTKDHQIIMLEPGTYALKKFQTSNSSYGVSWIESKNQIYDVQKNQPAISSFNAKAGKITYLGDIRFSSYVVGRAKWGSNKRDAIPRFYISNNLESAKKAFYSKYPNLKNYEITTNLIKINEKNK